MGTLGANTGKILFADSVYIYGCVFNNVGSPCDTSRLFKPIGVRAKRVPLAFNRASEASERFLIRTGVRINKGGVCVGLLSARGFGLRVCTGFLWLLRGIPSGLRLYDYRTLKTRSEMDLT